MKNFIIATVFLSVVFYSCKNAYENEHQQIKDLQITIDGAEEVLLSVDTASTFALVREIKQDLSQLGIKYDSLDKEAAFKVADYFSNKKSLYFLHDNYTKFINEIKTARIQLKALQQDLDNGIITQVQFLDYYKNEQAIILDLNDKINKAVSSIAISIDRIKKSKKEVKELLKEYETTE
jgi:hypothetical protein